MKSAKVIKAELAELLGKAERTVGNVGQWVHNYEFQSGLSSIEIWIGDKGGSRVNQYEATCKLGGLSTELRAKTFSALSKKIISVVLERVQGYSK